VQDDGNLQVLLANSQQVKNLRGHKADRSDSRWLAHLLRHGMIRPSFIPAREVRELRDLTRRRKQLIQNAVEERNRVQRVLQEANVQMGVVLSNLFGESGLDMLDALVNRKPRSDRSCNWLRTPSASVASGCRWLSSRNLRKLYNDAGVSIYVVRDVRQGTDEDLDYTFTVAKTLGATYVTLELPTGPNVTQELKKLGDWAAKYKMLAAYHTHQQGSMTALNDAFEVSKGNAANVDLGHFMAATNPGGAHSTS
jgi:hypothetical protein